MPKYRAYCYNGSEGLWVDNEIDAPDDERAVALVRSIKEARIAEVWQGPRLVETIDQGAVSRSVISAEVRAG